MSIRRILGDSYPNVYDKWQEDGVTWIIQDLPAEDHDEALRVLVDYLCTDEVLCNINNLLDEPESVRGIIDFWRIYLAKNMSLGCYIEEEGVKRLVALNVCYIGYEENTEGIVEIEGEKWKNVYAVLDYCERKFNVHKYLGESKLLGGMGLVVSSKYRGVRLGARILAAREPLCRLNGIKGAWSVFTGIASQKLAARCGYISVLEVPLGELADIGLKYPRDDLRSVKLMVKKI